MTRFTVVAAYAGIVLSTLAGAGPTVHAAEAAGDVRVGQAVVTKLGADASAVTYWVGGSDGWQVVTTIDSRTGGDVDHEEHAIVRFSALLLPGQSQSISVPVAVGELQPSLQIRRIADRIEVERNPVLSD